MKKPRFMKHGLIGLAVSLLGLASATATAQNTLPYPDPHFRGTVGTTFQDSDPARFPQAVRAPKGAPNVLVILLDDVGFGQFSVTGGGVPSPNMEKLAKSGVLYNRFHTTALCSPTRAALLTGRNHHTANSGVITELGTGYDGYTGIIPQETATVAEVLRQNGYNTGWFGKNHNTPPYETSPNGPFNRWPMGLGFNYFYGFNAGDTSQWEPILFENQTPVPRSTDPDYHLTPDLVNKTIAWIQRSKEIEPDKPYFAYLAPGATHAPHHAPKEYIAKYKGQFDEGWDRYREVTFERQKKMGVIPANAVLTPRPASLPAWDGLPAEHKKLFARMMEVYAAFGDHTDHEIGRVIDAVRAMPDGDNTMIMYIVGDNGASAEGGLAGQINEISLFNGMVEKAEDIMPFADELGGPKHFNHFPAMWAHAMSTPFQWTKQVASHFGGVRNPMIVSWPKGIKARGEIRSQFSHVTDIAPTILEAAGIPMPTSVNGIAQRPLDGMALEYSFDDAKAKERHKTQVFELLVNRGLYKDGWFISSKSFEPWNPNRAAFDPLKAPWELYNIDEDFSQARDLAKENPDKLAAMERLWWAEAARTNILPLDWRGAIRFSAQATGKPQIAAGRDTFVYTSGLTLLPEAAAPDLKNKTFTLSADVTLKQGDDGVIFTQGGFAGGWVLMVQNGKLALVHNFIDYARYRVESNEPLPDGRVTVTARFEYTGDKAMGKGGKVTLTANGKTIGSGEIARTMPFIYSINETQDIGRDEGTPVDNSYQPPFAFKGRIHKMTVALGK